MKDNDKRTLREVHESEPNPYTDRQNLEPQPTEEEVDSEAAEYDGDIAQAKPESDIQDYVRQDTSDVPAEDEAPRNSDDDDPWGDGIHDTPLVKRYEDMADRDELARRVEELVADAYDWVGRAEDGDAQEIYDTLLEVSERLGNPSEETIRTEPVELPSERDEADP